MLNNDYNYNLIKNPEFGLKKKYVQEKKSFFIKVTIGLFLTPKQNELEIFTSIF